MSAIPKDGDNDLVESMVRRSVASRPRISRRTVRDYQSVEAYQCPTCDKQFFEHVYDRLGTYTHDIRYTQPEKPNYCPYCGQAIDWEVQDE